MYIKQNEYFTVKEDTAEAIDITFSLREKSISNIARLYDDEVPCSYNESDRYISEIIFYYLIWKKFGAFAPKVWCIIGAFAPKFGASWCICTNGT